MKKKWGTNFGLFCAGAMLFFIIFNTKVYQDKISEINRVSQELISQDAIFFRSDLQKMDFHEIYRIFPDHGILYNDLSWHQNCKGILFKKSIPEMPILQGRFFKESDIGQNVAVAGKDIISNLEEQSIISLNNINYKVIGIMGTDYDTKLDDAIWIPLSSSNMNPSGLFTVDGLRKEEILSLLGSSELWGNVILLDRENTGILEAMDQRDDFWILPVMILLTVWGYAYFFLEHWRSLHLNEIQVREEIGYPIVAINAILIKKSLIPYLKGVCVSFLLLHSFEFSSFQTVLFAFFTTTLLFFALWIVQFFKEKIGK